MRKKGCNLQMEKWRWRIRSEGRLWEDAEKDVPKGDMHCRSTSDLQRRMASLMVVRRVCFWRSVMADDNDGGGGIFPLSLYMKPTPFLAR